MKLSRVFPTKTSMTPIDQHTYFSEPDLFTPHYDKVMISTVFTWDKPRAERLAEAWRSVADEVTVGGPAYNDSGGEFEPGLFLRQGVTITSRGCPNRCSFCLVGKREGNIRELEIKPGNIVQDNNLLACSNRHIDRVFKMLSTQRAIEFKGGFEAVRVTTEIAERLRGIRVKSIWLACDHRNAVKPLERAAEILKRAGFKQWQLFCYVLIGDDMTENEARVRRVYEIGLMPFAQLYQPPDKKIDYSIEWKRFARTWSRPAAYKALLSGNTKRR
jgi:hypothetical protein